MLLENLSKEIYPFRSAFSCESALVTGGAGFIGSHLVELLVAEEHEPVAWITCPTASGRTSPQVSLSSRLTF